MGGSVVVGLVLFWLLLSLKVLNEYERGVVFRLGKLQRQAKGPGLVLVVWPIDRMQRVSLRTVVHDVPPQDVITRDNVSVKVNAVVYFRVIDPVQAVVQVEDYLYATSQMAQTTLRSILGQAHLDELLSERERLGQMLQEVIDLHTDPWGVKVSQVAVKAVDLPHEMVRAMARQAESEREKRAKIIHASGEFEASRQLTEAAQTLASTFGGPIRSSSSTAQEATGSQACNWCASQPATRRGSSVSCAARTMSASTLGC